MTFATIRLGAAYDTVSIHSAKGTVTVDRAAMRKNKDFKSVDRLRHDVRDTWSALSGFDSHSKVKAKGNKRREGERKQKEKREHA